jgi:5'(3')-deoxyribonucleotidase
MRPEILLDIDGVVASFVAKCLPHIETITGRTHTHDDVTEWYIEKALGLDDDQTAQLYKYVSTEGWCQDLPLIEEAKQSIATLRKYADVIPVTSHFFDSKTWAYDRDEWIVEHLGIPKTDIVHTHRKYQVDGDVLIDDKPSHLYAWCGRRPGKMGILFQQSYNTNEVIPRGVNVMPIKGWPALVAALADKFGWFADAVSLEGHSP